MGPNAKVVFPMGLVKSEIEGEQVYILSAGVNDSSIKNFVIVDHFRTNTKLRLSWGVPQFTNKDNYAS